MVHGEQVKAGKRKWLRRLLWAGSLLVVMLLLIGFLFPYLLKRYIEDHSVEWIDRKVSIGRIVLNPFTFTYGIDRFTCYEPRSSEVFISWGKVSVQTNLWKGFLEDHWRFRELEIRDPYFHIVQRGDRFNFSDLLALGGSDSVVSAPADTVPVLFSMEDIRLSGGRIVYAADLLKEPAEVTGLDVACNRITSESARMDFDLSLSLAKGGTLKGGFMIDTDRSLYAIDTKLAAFALPQLLPYLQDFMHTTALNGDVDLDLHLRDSWATDNALAVRAELVMNGLDITDDKGEPLIGLKSARVRLDTLNAQDDSFDLRSIVVDGFHTRFQMWADGSQTWGKVLKLDSTSTAGDSTVTLAASDDNVFVMLADYIRMLGQDLVANEYNADSLAFTNGELVFEDFTPERPFRYTLSELAVRSTRMNSDAGSVDFDASATLNGKGKLTSSFKFDPKNFKNVDATMEVEDLALADLDAYGRWYAAHPFEQGTMSYAGHTRIAEGKINSENHLQARQMKVGRKVDAHDPEIFVLPMRLAVGLLKDVKGNIDLDVPVEGDLNDPRFKPWPIIWKVLKNLLVKAVTAPGRLIGRALGGGEDADLESLRFGLLQTRLGEKQRKALGRLVEGLEAKPELSVSLVPLVDPREEEEELASFLVKQQFLQLGGPLSAADSSRILALSTRDTLFVGFLNVRSPGTAGLGERQRCLAITGADAAKARCLELEMTRQAAIRADLQARGLGASRFSIRPGTAEETSGALGSPGYKLVYDIAEDPPATGPL